jgi:hypothetical protein
VLLPISIGNLCRIIGDEIYVSIEDMITASRRAGITGITTAHITPQLFDPDPLTCETWTG